MAEETWKPVVGYEGLYEVSDHGRVRAMFESWNGRYKSGRILKQLNHNHGYFLVNLYYPETHQRGRTRTVHSLVLESFVSPRPEGNDARHLDGNKKNNRIENLEWGTRLENVQDSIKHGTFVHGERVHFCKLDEGKVIQIRALVDSGVLCKTISERFGISIAQACRIGARKSWSYLQEA